MYKNAQAAVPVQTHTAFPALLWDPLPFAPYQHCPIPLCLFPTTLLGLPLLLPLSFKRLWPGVVLKDRTVGDGKVCAPISALLSQAVEVTTVRRAQNSHRGDACLRWCGGQFYMNQKMCYLMEDSPNSRPSSTTIPQQAYGRESNICPGNVSRNDFILSPGKSNISLCLLVRTFQMFCRLRPRMAPLD